MAEKNNVFTLIGDEEFDFEEQREIVGPRGEVYIVKKSRATSTLRRAGFPQTSYTERSHAAMTWENVEKRLYTAELQYLEALDNVKLAFDRFDGFIESFGELGLSEAKGWTERIAKFRRHQQYAAEKAAEEDRRDALEKEIERREAAEREKEIAEEKQKQEEQRKLKEAHTREMERLEKEAEQKRQKAQKEVAKAREEMLAANRRYMEIGHAAMFADQKEADQRANLQYLAKYGKQSYCRKCGMRGVTRHWECPNVESHYLVEKNFTAKPQR